MHDWSISRSIARQSKVPVFLAGGLNPANIGQAIRTVRPYGVDVCTGVRTNGALDAGKLRALVEAIREADLAAADAAPDVPRGSHARP